MATNGTDYDSLEAQAAMTWEHTKLSVKQQEAAFVKGAAKGVASSVVRGAVAIPALFRAIGPYYSLDDVAQLDKDTKNLMADKLDIGGQETGFDAGNTIGDVGQVVLDPVASGSKVAFKAMLLPFWAIETSGNPIARLAAHVQNAVGHPKVVEFDGKRLYNVDFTKIDLNLDKLTKSDASGVGANDIFPSEELDALVPDLSSVVKVKVTDNLGGQGRATYIKDAEGSVTGIQIELDKAHLVKDDDLEIKNSFVHEYQHAAQMWLGMQSRGTSPRAVMEKIKREAKDRNESLPSEPELKELSRLLYETNLGEQEARLAADIATGRGAEKPYPKELGWTESDSDEFWGSYLEARKRQVEP